MLWVRVSQEAKDSRDRQAGSKSSGDEAEVLVPHKGGLCSHIDSREKSCIMLQQGSP